MPSANGYVPTNETYSAPLAIPLTHESCWQGAGSSYGPFSVVRFNFVLRRSPLDGVSYGEAVAHLQAPAGADLTDRRLIRYEYERVTTAGIIEEQIVNSEVVSRIRADATVTATNLAEFNLGADLESHLSTAFRESRNFEIRDGRKVTVEREISFKVKGGSAPAVHAVPYKRWKMTVRLSHIDYLTVTYRPRQVGLRVERAKEPPLFQSRMHVNFRKSGLLLGDFLYWVPVGDAATNLVDGDEHFEKQINPSHVEFVPAEDEHRQFYDLRDFRGTPSLYKIANAAFPLKKSQRDEAWSNSELLELLDVEPEDAVYIWEANRRWRRRRAG